MPSSESISETASTSSSSISAATSCKSRVSSKPAMSTSRSVFDNFLKRC